MKKETFYWLCRIFSWFCTATSIVILYLCVDNLCQENPECNYFWLLLTAFGLTIFGEFVYMWGVDRLHEED